MNTIRLALLVLFGLGISVLPAATTYNYWQAVDGDYNGRWGDAAHWSEGHVPTTGEFATIDPTRETPSAAATFSIEVDADYDADTLVVGDPNNATRKIDVTFTGSGTVTCSGSSPHLFRACTAITFDGPSFTLSGNANPLNYSPVTVKGGSTLYINATLTFWKTRDFLTVDEGGTVSVGGVCYNNTGDRSITVNAGGTFICRGTYSPYTGTTEFSQAFALLINGGEVRIADLQLTRAAAYVKMTSGSLFLANAPTLCDLSQLQITGGRLSYGFNVLQDESDPWYTLATNHTLTGCNVFHATNGVTFTCHETFYVSQLRIADHDNDAQIDCDRLVFDGKNPPFAFTHSSNRRLNLYGPTDIYVDGRNLSGFNNHYILCHGRITVHTEDWSDPSVKRTVAIRGLGSAEGSLDLVVTGGGTFKYGQVWSYETMRSFTVEEDTALNLGNRDAKIGNSTEWGPLVTESLTLGKDVTVAFTAGEQHIAASTWNIDPSVRITVTIPETYTSEKLEVTSGAFPVLQDLDSKPLSDALLAQITLAGNAEGWSLVNEYGQISVVKHDSALLGTFGDFEWLGGSGNNWTTVANWNGGTPVESKAHVFGASENRVVSFNGAKADGTGTTLGSIEFKECADRSFFIDGPKQATFSISPSVKSSSYVPQILAVGHRETATKEIVSVNGGPLVFANKSYDGSKKASGFQGKSGSVEDIKYTGDVRVGCGSTLLRALLPQGNRTHFPSYRTCLTVLAGGELKFPNQNSEFTAEFSNFRVSTGGTLTFNVADGALYGWSRRTASIVVDGTLNIGPTLQGGFDQVYRGSGTLNLTGGVTPNRASSRVKFADALTVDLPSDWPTAVAGSESIALALGATAGAPTLRVPTAWAYGVPDGVAATSLAADRALALENDAALVLDPQGGTATVNEAVSGFGTLAITNGTLVLNVSSDASEATLATHAAGTLRVNGAQRLAGISLASGTSATIASTLTLDALAAAGAKVDLASDGILELTGDVDVGGIEFAFTANTGSQRTLVRAAGAITGTPANASRLAYRTLVEDGVTLLQAGTPGLVFIIK